MDYILPHREDPTKNILLTFNLELISPFDNAYIINYIRHEAFTLDNNYYSFDSEGQAVLNTMSFQEARQYTGPDFHTQGGTPSDDVSTYGVSVSITGNWLARSGKVVDSLIEFNPTLNGTSDFSGINIYDIYGDGLKVNEDTTLIGYIVDQNDISLYDSTGTNPIENIDFTFDQIDFDNSYQLTHVTQSFYHH